MSQNLIYTLPAVAGAGATEPESLADQIERGLLGTPSPTIPGDKPEDKEWAYKRRVPTVVLYDEVGLRLYDKITSDADEYYLFPDELNLFKKHGPEIARAMGFPGREHSQITAKVAEKPSRRDRHFHAPPQPWKTARWGDTEVGKWNNGVNGEEGLGGGWKRGWDVVELGAGALRKTAHLLTALADSLPPPPEDAAEAPAPITYHALDLSKSELDRVLGEMGESYGDILNGRVSTVGLHGDYFAGLQFVRDGGLDNVGGEIASLASTPSTHPSDIPQSPASIVLTTPATECVNLPGVADADPSMSQFCLSLPDECTQWSSTPAPEVPSGRPNQVDGRNDERRPLHILFIGSSLGNFDRHEAAPFLRSLPLQSGDTLLLGLDGRPVPGLEGKRKVEMAYNDPKGYTRSFEEHGWRVARRELGLEPDQGIEFVGRYNESLGRHEAYYRSKKEQTIPLPSGQEVTLATGELLHIEWSYKYSMSEALDLFNDADLTVINSWKAPNSEYRLWLLQRPTVRFNEPVKDAATVTTPKMALPRGVPTWDEWTAMWALWDHITLTMIPPEMLHTKPIDLRHICLFYLGHIPTFLDIFLSRITDGTHTHPTFKDIFERGIDPDVDDPTKIHPHSEVPTDESSWPRLEEILTFRDAVRMRLRNIYDEMEGGKQMSRHALRSIFMGYEHEAMHAETLLYMLLQSPLTLPPSVEPQWDSLVSRWKRALANAVAHGANVGIIDIPTTTVVLGHSDLEADDGQPAVSDHEFGWDNENPQHAVSVPSFKAEAFPVTNGEFRVFLAANEASTVPASWVEIEGELRVRTLYGPVPFDVATDWPFMGSRDELAAYAAARGGRLPTEPELRALWAHPQGPRPSGRTANVGFKHWHPIPPMPTMLDTDGRVLHGHNGGVWEWTSTPFEGYPGFVASKLYPGYSADFFDGKHWVVLGGSFATVPQIAGRASFRNWYQGNYRYAWVGGRVVYDA